MPNTRPPSADATAGDELRWAQEWAEKHPDGSVEISCALLVRLAARRDDAAGLSWSDARSILMQGAAIQQDYAAGNHATYEHYAARIDEAAREIADGRRYPAIDAKQNPAPDEDVLFLREFASHERGIVADWLRRIANRLEGK